jgi:hypothetical protein
MKESVKQILKDKEGCYNLRELVTMIFVVITIISWAAQQFFGIAVPEYMFYSFVSIIGAGCFGYSIERKAKASPQPSPNGEGENK